MSSEMEIIIAESLGIALGINTHGREKEAEFGKKEVQLKAVSIRNSAHPRGRSEGGMTFLSSAELGQQGWPLCTKVN